MCRGIVARENSNQANIVARRPASANDQNGIAWQEVVGVLCVTCVRKPGENVKKEDDVFSLSTKRLFASTLFRIILFLMRKLGAQFPISSAFANGNRSCLFLAFVFSASLNALNLVIFSLQFIMLSLPSLRVHWEVDSSQRRSPNIQYSLPNMRPVVRFQQDERHSISENMVIWYYTNQRKTHKKMEASYIILNWFDA